MKSFAVIHPDLSMHCHKGRKLVAEMWMDPGYSKPGLAMAPVPEAPVHLQVP